MTRFLRRLVVPLAMIFTACSGNHDTALDTTHRGEVAYATTPSYWIPPRRTSSGSHSIEFFRDPSEAGDLQESHLRGYRLRSTAGGNYTVSIEEARQDRKIVSFDIELLPSRPTELVVELQGLSSRSPRLRVLKFIGDAFVVEGELALPNWATQRHGARMTSGWSRNERNSWLPLEEDQILDTWSWNGSFSGILASILLRGGGYNTPGVPGLTENVSEWPRAVWAVSIRKSDSVGGTAPR